MRVGLVAYDMRNDTVLTVLGEWVGDFHWLDS